MPVVKCKHIVSFSSEDKVYRASNLLLGGNSVQKWKCEKAGERQASVILQLQKAVEVKSIDIGNESSAFIEVLVSRSSDAENYQVLLVASAFMSPVDSRNGVGMNRVRMFDKEKLSPNVSSEKWDRIKVVCTQPFNKHTTYGLSFIKVYTHEEEQSVLKDDNPDATVKTFGMFKLKSETTKQNSTPSAFKIKQSLPNVEETTRKRKIISQEKTTHSLSSPAPIRKMIKVEKDTPKKRKIEIPSSTSVDTKKHLTLKQVFSSSNIIKMESKPKPTKDKSVPTPSKKSNVPYNEILKGVVIALSGFQNPKRGEMRDKAVRMGALYRRDWDAQCTHLVCAFRNTPKFVKVVQENGKVVDSKWIDDCALNNKLLSWKKYNWNPKMSFDNDSDDHNESSDTDGAENENEASLATKDPYDESTDEDTDNENQLHIGTKYQSSNNVDPYDVSTDDEVTTSTDIAEDDVSLPSYFDGVRFMLFGDFSNGVERLLTRHIVSCGGIIDKYMSDNVQLVITEAFWDSTFDEAIAENSALVFIRPMWVFECGKARQKLPYNTNIVIS